MISITLLVPIYLSNLENTTKHNDYTKKFSLSNISLLLFSKVTLFQKKKGQKRKLIYYFGQMNIYFGASKSLIVDT